MPTLENMENIFIMTKTWQELPQKALSPLSYFIMDMINKVRRGDMFRIPDIFFFLKKAAIECSSFWTKRCGEINRKCSGSTRIKKGRPINVPRMSGPFSDYADISSFAVDSPSLAYLTMSVTTEGMYPNMHSNLPTSPDPDVGRLLILIRIVFRIWINATVNKKTGCFVSRLDVLRPPFDSLVARRIPSPYGDENRDVAQHG